MEPQQQKHQHKQPAGNKVTINYTKELYTTDNRNTIKRLFNNVWSSKNATQATIKVNYNNKEKEINIFQSDFDDNFERVMKKIKKLKTFKK